jgi:hypothetical protein
MGEVSRTMSGFVETLSASELEALCTADRATMQRFVHAFQRWRHGRA